MDRTERPTCRTTTPSILDTIGEEIIRIITPVSICMFMVVILVTLLNNPSNSTQQQSISTIATIAYTENTNDTIWDKFQGALLNSLVFVTVVTLVTFMLVFLFYIRCTKFLKYYMGFSAFFVLLFMGGQVCIFLVNKFSVKVDVVTFCIGLLNFAVVGVIAVYVSKTAIFVTQGYLVLIGMLVAFWFTMLPEWTTWALLVALAVYDLGAVLLPVGPLRLLVELAMSRDEDIPALVYEARPVVNVDGVGEGSGGVGQRRLWRARRDGEEEGNESGNNAVVESEGSGVSGGDGRDLVNVEEGRVLDNGRDLVAPLLEEGMSVQQQRVQGVLASDESMAFEGIGLGSSGAIKLGLGDFIFYSVLVGRAAMYDFMTVYACYLAIIAGLGVTLMLLAVYQKALPALPVSIMLGVLFYVLTRTLLEEFMMQCSMNFVMF